MPSWVGGSSSSLHLLKKKTLRNNFDGNAGAKGVDQFRGVPVGQTKTAVGTGAGDILGFRGAMNAVALEGKADPGRADRVVGTRRENQFIRDPFFEGDIDENLGVEGIVGDWERY